MIGRIISAAVEIDETAIFTQILEDNTLHLHYPGLSVFVSLSALQALTKHAEDFVNGRSKEKEKRDLAEEVQGQVEDSKEISEAQADGFPV
jgi:hypothetical protein